MLLYSDMENNKDHTNRQADAVKALMFLDVYKEHLGIGKLNKIGAINTYYSKERRLVLEKRSDVLKEYRTLLKNMPSELGTVGSNLNSDDESSDFVDSINLQLLYIRSLNNISASNLNLMLYVSRDNLEKYISEFLDKPGVRQRILDKTLDWGNEQDLLFILLSRAYQAYNNYELSSDTSGVSEYSLNFNNLTTAVLQFWDIKTRRYSPSGRANEGIMGGLSTSTPNKQFSKDIRYFNEIINAIVNNVREEEIKESAKIRKITTEYYKYKNYTGQFQKLTWGTTSHLYENLYEDLSILKLKDPYIDATLLPEERSYLKKKLLLLNAYFLHLTPKELDLLDPENPETFSQIDRLQLRYTSGDYFLLPLVKSQYISAHKEFFKSPVTHVINSFKETLNDITKQNYTASEIKDLEKNVNELTMPDRSRSQNTREKRQQMINSSGIAYFDINLDTVAHAFMDNAVKVKAMKDQKILIASFLTEWAAKNKDHKTKDKV